MLLTCNNKNKKGVGKTTDTDPISDSRKTGVGAGAGTRRGLIDPKHEKLISFNTTTSVAPALAPGIMFKKHCCKKTGTGTGRPMLPMPTPTPTWLINPATPPQSPKESSNQSKTKTNPVKVKVAQGKSFSDSFIPRRKSQSQQKKDQPQKKLEQKQARSVSTSLQTLSKMDRNRIQITISRDDGKINTNKPATEDDLNLTKIMCNFISAAETPSNLSPETRRASTGTTMIEGGGGQNKDKSDPQNISGQKVGINSESGCLDFGARDFLCDFNTKREDEDEIEVDISSDTDSCNFIAATPPNRFSDSDFDAIEPISITLETSLNPQQQGKVIIHKIEGPGPGTGSTRWRPDTGTGVNVTALLPRRPFRRHISLPPSIFMSRFFGQATATATTTGSTDSSPLISPKNEMTFILKSVAAASTLGLGHGPGPGPFHYPRINRFESISSGDVAEELLLHGYCSKTKSNSSWSMSIDSPSSGSEFELGESSECAFTSEIEKRALIVRSMRRLVRQDTTVGNFAPAHFCNT